MPSQTTCGIFVPDQRSSPEPFEWEHWLQEPRLPENWPQGVSDSEESHKGNRWNTRPSITQPPVVPYEGHLIQTTNKNTNPVISRQDYHLTQPCPSEEKHTNNTSAQISPYTKLTQTTGPTLGGQKEERIQPSSRKEPNFPWSLRNGQLKHNNFKKRKKKKRKSREILHKWRNKLETQKSK